MKKENIKKVILYKNAPGKTPVDVYHTTNNITYIVTSFEMLATAPPAVRDFINESINTNNNINLDVIHIYN